MLLRIVVTHTRTVTTQQEDQVLPLLCVDLVGPVGEDSSSTTPSSGPGEGFGVLEPSRGLGSGGRLCVEPCQR